METMTVATLAPTALDADLLKAYARRYGVAYLLDNSAQRSMVRSFVTAIADVDPDGHYRPGNDFVAYDPRNATATPTFLNGQSVAPQPSPEVAMEATVHQLPTPAQAPTTITTQTPTVAPQPALAGHERKVQVRIETLQSCYADDGILIARLLHFRSRTQGDICHPIAELEAALGIKRRSLKAATMPQPLANDDGNPLPAQRIERVITLRMKDNGQQDIYIDSQGRECWRFDVHHTITFTTDDEGNKVLSDKADRYVSIPLTWLFTDKTDGPLTATPYASSTIWAAAITRAWLGRRERAQVSMQQLASLGRCSSRAKFIKWWGAAEDAGLVSAPGLRGGYRTAERLTHEQPLPAHADTCVCQRDRKDTCENRCTCVCTCACGRTDRNRMESLKGEQPTPLCEEEQVVHEVPF